MSFELSEATYDDVSATLAFARRLFQESPPGIFEQDATLLTSATQEAHLAKYLEPSNSFYLIAQDGEKVIGVAGLLGREHPQEAHVGFVGIAVDRDWRGRGVGTALMRAIIDLAPDYGIRRIELGVFENNSAVLAFYERLGFHVDAVKEAAILYKGDYIAEYDLSLVLP